MFKNRGTASRYAHEKMRSRGQVPYTRLFDFIYWAES